MAKVSPIGRVSYPQVFEAKSFEDGKPKFSITLLFPKEGTDLSEMKTIAKQTVQAKYPDGKLPPNFKTPFRDGDLEKPDDDAYKGMIFVRFQCNEDRPPQVVNNLKQLIKKESGEFYPGCWARVSYSCFCYDKAGNKGVAFGLNNVQKIRDDDSFNGRTNADSDFDAVGETSSNDTNADLFGD